MDDTWLPLTRALDDIAGRGQTAEIWWRDDDAVTTTPALDRLAALAQTYRFPLLLAVIPAQADAALAAFTRAEPLLTPTQHGLAHTNHATPGGRACELGGTRSNAAVLADLARGRDRMATLFGGTEADILVPPWNRIAPEVLPHLAGAGYRALSTFAEAHAGNPHIPTMNCDLDIIDWRHGRRCHPEGKLVGRLAELVGRARPIGVLTHHLAHDAAAWAFLDRAFARLTAHEAVRFATPAIVSMVDKATALPHKHAR